MFEQPEVKELDRTVLSRPVTFDGAAIRPNPGVSATEYSITGELPKVLHAVQSIFETYPAEGYGTYLKYMTQLSDGSYGAFMARSNSCD